MTKPKTGHPPSLIRVFTVPMKKAWVLNYQLSARLGGCPGWSESSLGAVILLILSCHGSNVHDLWIKRKVPDCSPAVLSVLTIFLAKFHWFWQFLLSVMENMRRLMTKPTKWHVSPAKTQISLGIHPVWSESLPCTQWVAKGPSCLHADSEDSDQTGLMPRLIWVFAGRTCNFVGFVMRQIICILDLSWIIWPSEII